MGLERKQGEAGPSLLSQLASSRPVGSSPMALSLKCQSSQLHSTFFISIQFTLRTLLVPLVEGLEATEMCVFLLGSNSTGVRSD